MKMHPKSTPDSTPDAPHGSTTLKRKGKAASGPCRGVRYIESPNRPSPYGVEWRVNGERQRAFFKRAADRDAKGAELARGRRQGYSPLDRDQALAWQGFKTAIGDTPWQDVVAGWKVYCKDHGINRVERTVSEACTEYLKHCEERLKAKELAADTVRHRRHTLNLFATAFGTNPFSSITGLRIKTWIEKTLGFTDPHTFNNYRKIVGGLYGYYSDELRNPIKDKHFPKRDDSNSDIKYLSVRDTAKLFAWAQVHGRNLIGRLALEAFAGVRFRTASLMIKDEIRLDTKTLVFEPEKSKNKERLTPDGYPDNLWAWIALANDECWALTSTQYMHLKSYAFAASGVSNPGNALRHNFATYHVAAFKSPGATARLLSHRNQEKLWTNYNGKAKEEEGKAYWTITPETAAAMAAG